MNFAIEFTTRYYFSIFPDTSITFAIEKAVKDKVCLIPFDNSAVFLFPFSRFYVPEHAEVKWKKKEVEKVSIFNLCAIFNRHLHSESEHTKKYREAER
jgi:hypothetical protein